MQIDAPASFIGEVSKLIQNKRGQLLEMNQEGEHVSIKCKLPVAEMFGLSNDLRSSTEGRGVSSLMDQEFQKTPTDLQAEVIRKIRQRKGLSENQ